jgi:transposase-like protein
MNAGEPQTLMQAVKYFADLNVCHAYMASLKWPDGRVICPKCGGDSIGIIASRRMFQCKAKECRKQFSVKVGTIFEDSPLGLDKWFVAVWSITNAKNGISSCELARATGVTQKSAWFMLHRVRLAMQYGSFDKFTGEVESDESYIGGASSNMHASRRNRKIVARGVAGKDIVHGVLNRSPNKGESKVRAAVVPDGKRETLTGKIAEHVEPGTTIYTDTHPAYHTLGQTYIHEMIDHATAYVAGRCHTNGLENFWSLFKRSIDGTYVSVDAPHLGRYVDEQVFRFNERHRNDAGRFEVVMPGVVGKRITYKQLIGAEAEGYSSGGNAGGGSKAN